MDISVGIYALAATKVATGSEVAGALAFGLGFIALTLANSELFTENFLVPVAPIVAGRARPVSLARLWGAALVMNLVGGWVMMGIVVGAFPRLRPTIVAIGTHYAHLGIGWTSFAAGVLGGVVITLMTWMEHSSESMVARLTAAVGAAFLLAIGPLDHAIVVSLEMFGALQAGARFGYLDWLGVLGWASLANIAGGLGFVTCLRLVQVGRKKIEETAAAPG
jgi:formate/nitrite transporter FocA (FNT family)